MNLLKHQNTTFLLIALLLTTQFCLAQDGSLAINQDPEIDELLALKKNSSTLIFLLKNDLIVNHNFLKKSFIFLDVVLTT